MNSSFNEGFIVWNAGAGAGGIVRSTGAGNISISGTGGGNNAAAGSNRGVLVNSTLQATGTGTITLTGTGGIGTDSYGILIDAGAIPVSTVNQPISLTANAMLFNSTVTAGTGQVAIRQATSGNLINLGGADTFTGTPRTLGLTDAELDRVTASTINIGDANSGAITVSAAIQHSGDKNFQVTTGRGISVPAAGSWTTTAGNLSLTANPSGTATGAFHGIDIQGSLLKTNGSGNLTLVGLGGDLSSINNIGVNVANGGRIETQAAGNITVTGTAGIGSQFSDGIIVFNGGRIDALPGSSGKITLTGTSCRRSRRRPPRHCDRQRRRDRPFPRLGRLGDHRLRRKSPHHRRSLWRLSGYVDSVHRHGKDHHHRHRRSGHQLSGRRTSEYRPDCLGQRRHYHPRHGRRQEPPISIPVFGFTPVPTFNRPPARRSP